MTILKLSGVDLNKQSKLIKENETLLYFRHSAPAIEYL